MERENKKRGRAEEEDEEKKKMIGGKRQEFRSNNIEFDFDKDSCFKDNSVGVFDFPWLKEGMISKSDDWKFEDGFSSSFVDHDNTGAGGVEFSDQTTWLDQTTPLPDFPDDKFGAEDSLWRFQGDDGLNGVDCIWSSIPDQSPAFDRLFH